MRRPAAAAAAGTAALVVLATVQVRRGLGVLHSVDSHAAYWRERAAGDGELLYVALGDSTAQGVGAPDPEDGYVGRLADDLARTSGSSVRVVNLSVSGARVADLVRDQLPRLAELLADEPAPALVTVTIGANDTGRTSRADFARSLQQVVHALPAGALVADVPHFRGRRGPASVELSQVVRELVSERPDLHVVDLHVATTHLGPRDYAHDLFHPSARGYARYYGAFLR